MAIKHIIAATLGALTFSATAMAYDTEREYLLDLYHGVNSQEIHVNEQANESQQDQEILFVDLTEEQRAGANNGALLSAESLR